jgi:shikimate dehydrogenase
MSDNHPIDRYAVLGNPVAHSQSPFIHAEFARQTGERLVYERVLAPMDGFETTVRAFAAAGGRGCNVTVPFKFEAPALAAHCSERARLAGAANVLRFDAEGWFADNTDGIGLVRDIEDGAGRALAGRRVLLVGAGGAGAGVLGPLLQACPAAVVLANRRVERARDLAARHVTLAIAQRVDLQACSLPDPAGVFDVVINASASSLAGAGSPVSAQVLRPGCLALDLAYGPPARPFLDWAASQGALTRDGLGMLVEQAAEAFALWRGVRPATDAVLAMLRQDVDAKAAL